MIGFTEGPQAWGLAQGMARVAGVNLPAALIEGRLIRAGLACLVGRCRTCGQSARCLRWPAVVNRAGFAGG